MQSILEDDLFSKPPERMNNQVYLGHSDVVYFTFHMFQIPDNNELEAFEFLRHGLSTFCDEPLSILQTLLKSESTLKLSKGNLHILEEIWTGTNTIVDQLSQEQTKTVRVLCFTKTYCNTTNWQIHRELHCLVWTEEAVILLGMAIDQLNEERRNKNLFNFMEIANVENDLSFESEKRDTQSTDLEALRRKLREIQNVRGKDSVEAAWNQSILVLRQDQSGHGFGTTRRINWHTPDDSSLDKLVQYWTFQNSRSFQQLPLLLLHYHRSGTLLRVPSEYRQPLSQPKLEVVIGIKPQGSLEWSPKCHLFSVFVTSTLGTGWGNTVSMKDSVQNALRKGNLFQVGVEEQDSQEPQDPTKAEMRLLRGWSTSLADLGMHVETWMNIPNVGIAFPPTIDLTMD